MAGGERHWGWVAWSVASLVLVLACILLARDFAAARDQATAESTRLQEQRTARGAEVLGQVADELKQAVESAASLIGEQDDLVPLVQPTGDVDEDIRGHLQAVVADAPDVNGVAFAATPDGPMPDCTGAEAPDREPPAHVEPDWFYSPYATRGSGELQTINLHDNDRIEDYRCLDWYQAAIAVAPKPTWSPPRFGRVSQTTLAFYSVAVLDDDDEILGVVLGTSGIEGLTSRLNYERISPFGYSYVEVADGSIASHPWGSAQPADCPDVVDDSMMSERPELGGLCEIIQAGRIVDGDVLDRDPVTRREARRVVAEVSEAEWSLVTVELLDEQPLADSTARTKAWIGVTGLLAVACAGIAWSSRRGIGWGHPWVLSASISLALIAAVGWTWWVEASNPQLGELRPGTAVDEFEPPDGRDAREVGVEVGLFVQSMEFLEANEIAVSGLLWQTGEPALAGDPVIFAEATAPARTARLWGEVDDREHGWQFAVTLRQEFNYAKYPLDHEQVWLRLWPNPSTEAVLVPDIDSMIVGAPSTLPGLADGLVLEGWSIERSYYASETRPVTTKVGGFTLGDQPLQPGVPQLLFVVDLQRDFWGPFVSWLIPLMAVNLLLFGLLLLVRTQLRSGADLSPMSTLSYAAALFFVVVVSHNELRSRLEASELLFLENFYFTTYLMLLLVAVNSLSLGSDTRLSEHLRRHDNLWARLAYWPVFTLLTMAATARAFL
ncbi:MAG: hypothetical protein AAF567_12965 [Actinomycetota bacterium]